jgi:hypothetical protein
MIGIPVLIVIFIYAARFGFILMCLNIITQAISDMTKSMQEISVSLRDISCTNRANASTKHHDTRPDMTLQGLQARVASLKKQCECEVAESASRRECMSELEAICRALCSAQSMTELESVCCKLGESG